MGCNCTLCAGRIGGLRDGQQMIQSEAVQSGGAGLVVSGIAGQGSTVAQQRMGRAQDTRPTTKVTAGSLCNILLTTDVHLKAIARR
jgi:hypothetical protein